MFPLNIRILMMPWKFCKVMKNIPLRGNLLGDLGNLLLVISDGPTHRCSKYGTQFQCCGNINEIIIFMSAIILIVKSKDAGHLT